MFNFLNFYLCITFLPSLWDASALSLCCVSPFKSYSIYINMFLDCSLTKLFNIYYKWMSYFINVFFSTFPFVFHFCYYAVQLLSLFRFTHISIRFLPSLLTHWRRKRNTIPYCKFFFSIIFLLLFISSYFLTHFLSSFTNSLQDVT